MPRSLQKPPMPRRLVWPLRTIGRLWMALGHRLGQINTFLLLAVVFYILITPLALLFRLVGRDALGIKWRRDRPSHWTVEPKRWSRESFRNQY